jgi:hypothetical protein
MAQDLSSPRAALASLERAYQQRDLEAALAAKDFRFEAETMLAAIAKKNNIADLADEEIIKQTEDVLRLSFVKEMQDRGFSDFSGYECRIVSETVLREDLTQLVEECVSKPDGSTTRYTHLSKKRDGVWRIAMVPGSE